MNIKAILKIILLCLVVGMALAALGATPATLGSWFIDKGAWAMRRAEGFYKWGGDYILLGAMVVLPILLIRWALGRRKLR